MNRDSLHPFQEKAIQFILDKKKSAVFLFLGAGKSVITLTAMKDMLDACIIKKVLIIGPLRVVNSVWPSEIKKWGHLKDLKISVATGSAKKREDALNTKADIYTINVENTKWIIDLYSKKKHWPFDAVVLDESSKFKSPSTHRFRALRKVMPHTTITVLLSGTPSPNSLIDLWSQMALIDGGNALGKNITAFRSRFCEVDYFGHNWSVKPGNESKIQTLIKPLCLSMLGSDYIKLPERTDIIENITLSEKVLKQYKDFERDLFMDHDGEEIEALSAGVLAGKLLQFSAGAIYVDDDHNWKELHTCKIDVLAELIEDNPSENLIVAYGYRHSLARITKRFPRAVMLDKEGKVLEKWNRGEIKLMLIHPQSAAHGINAQYGGSVMVWFDIPWSLENYAQACARIHRQGQENPVRIVHLVVENSIDERVVKVLGEKGAVQADLLEALR